MPTNESPVNKVPILERRCTSCISYGWPTSPMAITSLGSTIGATRGACIAKGLGLPINKPLNDNGTPMYIKSLNGVPIDVKIVAKCKMLNWRLVYHNGMEGSP